MKSNYAGFWLRVVAIVIDVIIIGCVQSFVVVPFLAVFGLGFIGSMGDMDMGDGESVAAMIAAFVAAAGAIWVLSTTIQLLYFSIMESSKAQATVGKMALGIVVTDMNGGRLSFAKAFVRNICKIISNFTFLIGYIIAGLTEKKQALHDIIAGTLVVVKPTSAPA